MFKLSNIIHIQNIFVVKKTWAICI